MKLQIKKFLKQIALFAILWGVGIYIICLAFPFHYFNSEYPMWVNKMEMAKNKSDYHNFILGDSRAIAGIDPTLLGSSYYNLALGGGTPMEGYFQLQKFLNTGQKIDTLVMSYAPIHFEQSEMFWDRQVKYDFYDLKDVNTIFSNINNQNEAFWEYDKNTTYSKDDKEKWLRKAFFTHYKSPLTLRAELSKSLLLRGYSNYQVYEDIKNRKGSYDFGTADFSHDLNIEAKRDDFKPKQVLLDCLKKTFDLAKEHNITVIYVNLPMNQTSYSSLKPGYKKGVLAMYGHLRTEFPEVLFKDNGLIYYNDEFFGDASHLNKSGRTKFSQETKKELNVNSLAINQNSVSNIN